MKLPDDWTEVTDYDQDIGPAMAHRANPTIPLSYDFDLAWIDHDGLVTAINPGGEEIDPPVDLVAWLKARAGR